MKNKLVFSLTLLGVLMGAQTHKTNAATPSPSPSPQPSSSPSPSPSPSSSASSSPAPSPSASVSPFPTAAPLFLSMPYVFYISSSSSCNDPNDQLADYSQVNSDLSYGAGQILVAAFNASKIPCTGGTCDVFAADSTVVYTVGGGDVTYKVVDGTPSGTAQGYLCVTSDN